MQIRRSGWWLIASIAIILILVIWLTRTHDEARQGLRNLNHVPIRFYGKLEDQFGNPVVGAEIAASIRIYSGFRSTVERFTVTSDDKGLFKIDHGKGESLGMMPRKPGYVVAAEHTAFKYSYLYQDHFTPDPQNPTVLKMWKLQGAELLLNIEQSYKLPYTNTPIHFDLLAGKIVPTGGDIIMTVNRSPGDITWQSHPDWSIQIEAVEGGMITNSVPHYRATYQAPEQGYQPILAQTCSTNIPDAWFAVFDRFLFVKSRNGRIYSKLQVSFTINYTSSEPMYVDLKGCANTNSSRNWEATIPQ